MNDADIARPASAAPAPPRETDWCPQCNGLVIAPNLLPAFPTPGLDMNGFCRCPTTGAGPTHLHRFEPILSRADGVRWWGCVECPERILEDDLMARTKGVCTPTPEEAPTGPLGAADVLAFYQRWSDLRVQP